MLMDGQEQNIEDVIKRIIHFSYIGDYRTIFGIDKNKIEEIFENLKNEILSI